MTPPPVTAALTTNHPITKPGDRIRLSLTLRNESGQKVSLSRSSRAAITLRQGATVLSRTTARLSAVKSGSVKPGGSVRLTTTLRTPAEIAALGSAGQGSDTIEIDYGPYTATTTIQVVGR